jgi:acyl-CoA synthetase (AMP-forming)/AMP-acid ligase II
MNIATLLQEQAARYPDVAAIIEGGGGKTRRHSFSALSSDSARTAALLEAKGIGRGDRVLVFQPMSYPLYVVLLAIFRLGGVAMFLDPSAGLAHIRQCCEIGRPRALVAGARAHLLRLVSAELRRIPVKFVTGRFVPGATSLRRADALAPRDGIANCTPQDPALLTFTSGSTGRPKAALRSQGFLMAQHRALAHALDLQPGEVDLTTLPIFLLANLASGLTSVIPQADLRYPGRIDAGPVVGQIDRLGITRSAGSPAFYRRLVEYCEAGDRRLDRLRRIDTGGAPVFPDLLGRIQAVAGNAQVVAVYGSTEAEPMAHIAWQSVGETELDAMRSGRGLLAGPPVREVDLRILPDRFGQPIGPFGRREFDAASLPVGGIGEIVVCGDHVLDGYVDGRGDRETKFDVDAARWHRTGDAGFLDDDGRLWLVGRCSARIEDARGVLYPYAVECAAQFDANVLRSAMVAHAGRRILLVEGEPALSLDGLKSRLAWAQLDEVRKVSRIPVDRRHNAKVDYNRVHTLLG